MDIISVGGALKQAAKMIEEALKGKTVKGKNCQIKSIIDKPDIEKVETTFIWYYDDGTEEESKMLVPYGVSIIGVTIEGDELFVHLSNGTTQHIGTLPKEPLEISSKEGNALQREDDGLYVTQTGVKIKSGTDNALQEIEGELFVQKVDTEDFVSKADFDYVADIVNTHSQDLEMLEGDGEGSINKKIADALDNFEHLTKEIIDTETLDSYIANPTLAKFNVLYLYKVESATGDDKFKEYQRIGTQESSTFEQTGDTSIDLTGYATETYVKNGYVAKRAGYDLISAEDLAKISQNSSDIESIEESIEGLATKAELGDYVAKKAGYDLSKNDFSDTEKAKVDSAVQSVSIDGVAQQKTGDSVSLDLSAYAKSADVVAKKSGYDLSQNDYSNEEKEKVATNTTDIAEVKETIESLATKQELEGYAKKGDLNGYVAKQTGKDLVDTTEYAQVKETLTETAEIVEGLVDTVIPTLATKQEIEGFVPATRKVNGKALSGDVTLSASDVGALPSDTPVVPTTRKINNKSLANDITLSATDVGALPSDTTHVSGDVPNSRTVNGKSLASDITLSASDVAALPDSTTHLSGDVPTTRKVNGKALSGDINLSASDVGALPSSTVIPTFVLDGTTLNITLPQ